MQWHCLSSSEENAARGGEVTLPLAELASSEHPAGGEHHVRADRDTQSDSNKARSCCPYYLASLARISARPAS
jgi:hypothetical protein